MKPLVFAVFLVACGAAQPLPGPEPPTPPPDPPSGEPCVRACARIEQLGCPEAEPEAGEDGQPGTADDVTCLAWLCAATYLDHEAIARARDCSILHESRPTPDVGPEHGGTP